MSIKHIFSWKEVRPTVDKLREARSKVAKQYLPCSVKGFQFVGWEMSDLMYWGHRELFRSKSSIIPAKQMMQDEAEVSERATNTDVTADVSIADVSADFSAGVGAEDRHEDPG